MKSIITSAKIEIIDTELEIRNLEANNPQTQQYLLAISNRQNKIKDINVKIDNAYAMLRDIETKLNVRVSTINNTTIKKAFENMIHDIRSFSTKKKASITNQTSTSNKEEDTVTTTTVPAELQTTVPQTQTTYNQAYITTPWYPPYQQYRAPEPRRMPEPPYIDGPNRHPDAPRPRTQQSQKRNTER